MSHASLKLETIAVIGLGLIGGSFALDIQRLGITKRVLGYDVQPEHCDAAKALGLAQHTSVTWDHELSHAELILLAIPVRSLRQVVSELRQWIQPGTILTDVGSVKAPIVAYMQNHPSEIWRFVGGHPIAGSEYFGPSSARPKLFAGKRFIVTPVPETDTEALTQVRQLWECLGSSVIEMTPEDHDHVFAWVSHLPHLLSYASIQAIAGAEHPEILSYSGAGLKDFSRIASSSPEMWADIFMDNQQHILPSLDQFRAILDQIQKAIQHEDTEGLIKLLREAKASRDYWVS